MKMIHLSLLKQVFYTKDPSDNWHVVANASLRDLFERI